MSPPAIYSRILVPYDGSPSSRQGLAEAIRVAKPFGSTIRIVHVIDEPRHIDGYVTYGAYADYILPHLREHAKRLVANAGRNVTDAGLRVESGIADIPGLRACDVVLREAADWGADLIVMGTHGRRGLDRLLLGSDAEQVLRGSPVPVLLVRCAPDVSRALIEDVPVASRC